MLAANIAQAFPVAAIPAVAAMRVVIDKKI
jgi:hypothetical protein